MAYEVYLLTLILNIENTASFFKNFFIILNTFVENNVVKYNIYIYIYQVGPIR